MSCVLDAISQVTLKSAICITFVNHIQQPMKHNNGHKLTRAMKDLKGHRMNLNVFIMLNGMWFSILFLLICYILCKKKNKM